MAADVLSTAKRGDLAIRDSPGGPNSGGTWQAGAT